MGVDPVAARRPPPPDRPALHSRDGFGRGPLLDVPREASSCRDGGSILPFEFSPHRLTVSGRQPRTSFCRAGGSRCVPEIRRRPLDASSCPDRTRIFRPGLSQIPVRIGILRPGIPVHRPEGSGLSLPTSPRRVSRSILRLAVRVFRSKVRLRRLERSVRPFAVSICLPDGPFLGLGFASVERRSRSVERRPGDPETAQGDFEPAPRDSKPMQAHGAWEDQPAPPIFGSKTSSMCSRGADPPPEDLEPPGALAKPASLAPAAGSFSSIRTQSISESPTFSPVWDRSKDVAPRSDPRTWHLAPVEPRPWGESRSTWLGGSLKISDGALKCSDGPTDKLNGSPDRLKPRSGNPDAPSGRLKAPSEHFNGTSKWPDELLGPDKKPSTPPKAALKSSGGPLEVPDGALK